MEEIGCILCGDGDGPVVIEENDYAGRVCTRCRLIYVSPRPTPAEIENLYAHDEAQVPVSVHFYRGLSQRLHARYILALIDHYLETESEPRALLEIGPGAGYFLDEARKVGFAVNSIELASALAEFIDGVLQVPCESTPLTSQTFGDRRFDVIYHCDVISHMYDPIEAFETTREKLRANGLVVFETGNLAEVSESELRRIPRFQYPDHLFFFGPQAIRKLLELTGFEVLEIRHHDLRPSEWLQKGTQAARNFSGSREQAGKSGPAQADRVPDRLDSFETGTGPKRWLKDWLQIMSFLLKYRVGPLIPDHGQRQTLVVVGRRR